jgi:hypothetical protein
MDTYPFIVFNVGEFLCIQDIISLKLTNKNSFYSLLDIEKYISDRILSGIYILHNSLLSHDARTINIPNLIITNFKLSIHFEKSYYNNRYNNIFKKHLIICKHQVDNTDQCTICYDRNVDHNKGDICCLCKIIYIEYIQHMKGRNSFCQMDLFCSFITSILMSLYH